MSTIMVDSGRVYILLWRAVERERIQTSQRLKCSGRRERTLRIAVTLGAVGSGSGGTHACLVWPICSAKVTC